MKVGPDISHVAALIGDPARTNILMALMNGDAWTAGDLAREAGVMPATASSHLSKLLAGGLVQRARQGRHQFYSLANEDVGEALEVLLRITVRAGHVRHIVAPHEAPLRLARVCYDHLAGEYGVHLLDFLRKSDLLRGQGQELQLSDHGTRFLEDFGIPVKQLAGQRRPVCRLCLDWSEQTHHLGGALGHALLARMMALKWLKKDPRTRAVAFTKNGKQAFANLIAGGSG